MNRAIFSLALQLGKTKAELMQGMGMHEFHEWLAYFASEADAVKERQRLADPRTPIEVDWASMTPQQIGAMIKR